MSERGASAPSSVGGATYSREEVTALQGIFSLYDADHSGRITVQELSAVLSKVCTVSKSSDVCVFERIVNPHVAASLT
jgi:Ca2+-binding EF-hand superfamily protein